LYKLIYPLKPANSGGYFDVVLGNPPYGASYPNEQKKYFQENYKSAKTISGVQKGCLDTFTLFIEKGYDLLKNGGILHYIIPVSISCSESMTALHKILFENCSKIQLSNYAKRPMQIFSSACTANSIFSFIKSNSKCENILTTKLNRLSKNSSVKKLIDNLNFIDGKRHYLFGRIPKISFEIENTILDKLFSGNNISIEKLKKGKGQGIFYRKAGGRYFNVISNHSTTASSSEGIIYFDMKLANSIGAILSSSLFWWFQQLYTDCFNLKMSDIDYFTIPKTEILEPQINEIGKIYTDYLIDIERNRTNQFNIRKSRNLIDKIDDLICPLYGLTQEETDFIKNYEIEFRLSGEE
jgi:hypothetical protein